MWKWYLNARHWNMFLVTHNSLRPLLPTCKCNAIAIKHIFVKHLMRPWNCQPEKVFFWKTSLIGILMFGSHHKKHIFAISPFSFTNKKNLIFADTFYFSTCSDQKHKFTLSKTTPSLNIFRIKKYHPFLVTYCVTQS